MYQTRYRCSCAASVSSLSVLCWRLQVFNTKISESPNSGVFIEFHFQTSYLHRVWGLKQKIQFPSHLQHCSDCVDTCLKASP